MRGDDGGFVSGTMADLGGGFLVKANAKFGISAKSWPIEVVVRRLESLPKK